MGTRLEPRRYDGRPQAHRPDDPWTVRDIVELVFYLLSMGLAIGAMIYGLFLLLAVAAE